MHASTTTPSRSGRWLALGLAAAVAFGAGGFGVAQATSPSGATAFVAITPCRLFDTRPDSQVGARGGPLGEGDTMTLRATGAAGNCTLPDSAAGVALNVTAVDATTLTYLTIWPAGEERPLASSLNPAPGAPPTPNAVTVDLSDGGEFSVFNRFGRVHVLADVVGYYTDHHHDDRYPDRSEVDAELAARIAALSDTIATLEQRLDARIDESDAALADVEAELARVDAASGAAWKPIPSGVTVTGHLSVVQSSTSGRTAHFATAELPGIPPQRLLWSTVNFAPFPWVPGLVADPDTGCTGTATAPTAPPGRVCVYLDGAPTGVSAVEAYPEGPRGIAVWYWPSDVMAGRQIHLHTVWAYTAP